MEAVNSALGAFPTALAGGLGLGICATGAAIYRVATRKKPTHVNVNCWFCSQDTTVPYGNRNCWDCPNCEQYNGFQENGDYNKPIPAQYMEHLNHMVTSWATPSQASKIQQWPNGQILFCKKCNNNQPLKIKQLASFVPRDEDKYEEEIEVYKHHLEQTYKLCRPCQTAVEYYIKHQDRQIRAILFDHQLRRREADKTFVQSSHYSSLSTPIRVLFLRFVAFVSCAVLVAMAVYGSGNPFTGQKPTAEMRVVDPMSNSSDETISPSDQRPVQNVTGWEQLLDVVPEEMLMNLQAAWDYGKNHQMAVVTTGLFTCLLAVFLAGRIRLRRIDAVASLLWLTVMSLHLMENYLQTDVPGWLDTLKFSTTSLCCLVGFTATIATRKSTGQRRYRARRYLSGESVNSFCSDGALSPCASSLASSFIPIPPSIPQLARQQLCRTTRRNSPCSLPGRLNRALSLGTIPSLTRTDSGYLFSGSRPPSQTTVGKDSPPSDAKSVEGGSIYSETTGQRKDSSSRSSACVVDTTTNVVGHQTSDIARGWKGFCGNILWTSLLGLSLTANLIFVSAYLYQGLH
ncbi:transmembrane protein 201 isoform X3 [Cetorhinus maximus]